MADPVSLSDTIRRALDLAGAEPPYRPDVIPPVHPRDGERADAVQRAREERGAPPLAGWDWWIVARGGPEPEERR